MKKIIFASSNRGKICEMKELLTESGFDLVAQTDYSLQDVEETGLSFVENAILKARHASAITGLPALADDSGLSIDALQGAPGIYSARYAGAHCTSADNIKKVLAALADIPTAKRTASFYCVLVFLTHANDPTPLICQGKWDGVILTEAQGVGGFGYDPIFYVPNEGVTAAELTSHRKNQISHRGLALRHLLQQLPEKYETI